VAQRFSAANARLAGLKPCATLVFSVVTGFDGEESGIRVARKRHAGDVTNFRQPRSGSAHLARRSSEHAGCTIDRRTVSQEAAMITLRNILVATDFSEPSDAALTYGRALARNFGATLHVVHVAGQVSTLVYGAEAYAVPMPELQQEVEDSARKQLASLMIDNDPLPLPKREVVVTSNAPAAAIVEYATRERIDLIVAGTHGRGGMAHLLMGSVAERIVRTAPCPVLTVRHPEHEFVVPDALVAVAKA